MSGNEELKQAILTWFRGKTGEKKTFYMKDVVKAMTEQGYAKRDIQKAVNDCTVDESLMYFSTGSTTMLVLPENFPKFVT